MSVLNAVISKLADDDVLAEIAKSEDSHRYEYKDRIREIYGEEPWQEEYIEVIKDLRFKAVAKINNRGLLVDIARSAVNKKVRNAAQEKLSE